MEIQITADTLWVLIAAILICQELCKYSFEERYSYRNGDNGFLAFRLWAYVW